MKKGVLFAAHGSRRTQTEDTVRAIANKVKEITGTEEVEVGFMELSDTLIPDALNKLAEAECDEIFVLPFFLINGIHITKDIPEVLEEWKKAHPGIEIVYGHTLGDDERLPNLLANQVEEFLKA